MSKYGTGYSFGDECNGEVTRCRMLCGVEDGIAVFCFCSARPSH